MEETQIAPLEDQISVTAHFTRPTPGPWKAVLRSQFGNDYQNYRRIEGGDGFSDETRVSFSVTGFISRADIQLMSAAPDLLEALQGFLEMLSHGSLRRNTSDDANPEWAMRQLPFALKLKRALEAISKATDLSGPEDQEEQEVLF